MSPDLVTLASSVLQRALQKAGYMPEAGGERNEPATPNDVLIDSLADKLLAFINHADAAAATAMRSASGTAVPDQMRSRLLDVARALGACDCFGDDASCPRCAGRGGPGWQLPERARFERLVRPALHRVSALRNAGRVHRGNSTHQ